MTHGHVDVADSVEQVDLRQLALLHDPALPGADAAELCENLGVAYDRADDLSRVRAVADCLRLLLDKIDAADPSWSLARACLVAGGLALARLVDCPPPGVVENGLIPLPDPLLRGDSQAEHRSAGDAVRAGLGGLADLGYASRPSQQEMARTVADVLDSGGLLAVEAPTGTGKSLAYLLPAAGRAAAVRRPVLVATATKVLQQQLRRDVLRMQGEGLFAAPLRQIFGVSNYICTRELATAIENSGLDAGPDHWLALAVGVRALAVTATGTWDDVSDHDVAQTRLDYRTSRDTLRTDAPSCERRHCRFAGQCPLMARLDGLKERPGVLAVNHALVAAWAKAALDTGRSPGDVLQPGTSDLVFDEAHDLEDSLTSAWTEVVGRRELSAFAARVDGRFGLDRMLRRLDKAHVSIRNGTALPTLVRQLRTGVASLTEAVGIYVHEYGGTNRTAVLVSGVVRLRSEYRELTDRAREVEQALRGLEAELIRLERGADQAMGEASGATRRLLHTVTIRTQGLVRAVDEIRAVLNAMQELPDEHLWVHQLRAEQPDDDEPAQWRFDRVPIDVGSAFAGGIIAPARSVTLTSATLTAGGGFDFISSRLGIRVEPGSTAPGVFDGRKLASPFDHAAQSAVVLTNHLPVPVPTQELEFVEELARDQVGFLSLTGGRAMTLFAARRRMKAVAELVRGRTAELGDIGVQLLVQGETGAAEISRRFRAEPGSVVYGLRSYWQGFDAPGDTLSYLLIEKPPYPHPDDAVVSARARAIADRGGDPFLDYLVPKTAVLMAQGFGRLIRSETDRGVALIGDRRMQSPSSANRMLLGTLPGPGLYYARDRDDVWRYAVRFVTGEEPDLSAALSLAGNDVDAALARLRLVAGEDPEAKLREAARVLFGVDQLRQEQLQVMLAHLAGRDTLGILPTGYGKSLCFQLPALLRPEDRATVVISPLVALIKDQLDDLRGRRGLRAVQGITGTTPGSLRNEILRDLADGRIRLLYVSPERLVRDPVLRVALEKQDLAGLVVDEAHCISDWGQDFRPDFRRVAKAVAHLDRAPRMALTATATAPVADDIAATLELDAPEAVHKPSDRPNLRFRVTRVDNERERAREVLRIATAMSDSPGIVYASRRALTEELAMLLRRAGIAARHYHAGMVPEQREAVQDDFLAGTTRVIVATKAFGMGVNKPDIAWVLHYDLPDSLDAYVQEAGRAARAADLRGECALLYTGGDIARRRRQVMDENTEGRLADARRVLGLLPTQRRRGADVVFDADELAEAAGLDVDELNVIIAWLERSGAVEQKPDCSARGVVFVGLREPEDAGRRRRFRELSVLLKLRPQVSSRIDLDALAESHGLDPDTLEQDLVEWSLERLLTFSSSQRLRRLRITSSEVDEHRLRTQIRAWNRWQRRQLDAVIGYVQSGRCRRTSVVEYFGFPGYTCGDEHERCDNCGGHSPWLDLSASGIPDPEQLINVELTVLQAVAWASTLTTGRYGEGGLKMAVLGVEGRELGAGLRRCPQFGALRHVRGADRRWDQAVTVLAGAGLIRRNPVQRDGRTYTSPAITDLGRSRLGGPRG